MHELSVTENILEIALRHANTANAKKITHIFLVIGDMASIIDDSVQFYWDIISKDTIADGSRLIFRRIPAEFQCRDCGTKYEINDDNFMCPNCSGIHVTLVSGDQFYVEAIDIDEKDDNND